MICFKKGHHLRRVMWVRYGSSVLLLLGFNIKFADCFIPFFITLSLSFLYSFAFPL
jgi:hypothetical protein